MAHYKIADHPYAILNNTQLERLHQAIIRQLSETGVIVESAEAIDILHGIGAKVWPDNRRVTIPEQCVLDAIKTTPKSIHLYGQHPEMEIEIGGNKVNTLGGAAAVTTHHLDGSFAPATLADLVSFNRLQDALEHLDVLHGIVDPTDVPAKLASRLYTIVAATNFATTYKPCALQVDNRPRGVNDLFQLAVMIRGSEEEARRRPLFSIHDTNARPPFVLQEENARVIIDAAKFEIPCGLMVWPVMGMTSPISIAGTLAVKFALYFAGLVLAQAVNPGSPFLFLVGCGAMDMRNATVLAGTPEVLLTQMAGLSLAQYYGLPSGAVAATDAKVPDAQASFEKMAYLLTLSLAGANIIHGTTSEMDGLMVASFEQCVIDDEIMGFVHRLLRGISISDEELGFEAARDVMVGPGDGDFMAHPHTLERFRNHMWIPNISSREATAQWRELGSPTAQQRARERAREILASHNPRPLADDLELELFRFACDGEPPVGILPHNR